MSKKNILRIILIIVLVCFLLPYVSVSCSTMKIIDANGYNLLVGGKVDTSSFNEMSKSFGTDIGDLGDLGDIGDNEVNKDNKDNDTGSSSQKGVAKDYGPQLMVILAFAAAIAGLIITFIRTKKAVLYSAIAAVAGFVCTIASIFTIRSWVTNNSAEAEAIIKINYQIGFFLILIGFAAAAVFGFYTIYYKKPIQLPNFGQQGQYSPGFSQQAPIVNTEQQYMPPQQESVSRFCSECGTKIGPGDEFCSNCGTKIQ